MILNNRKDTYDIKLSKRRIQFTGRRAAQTGASAGGGDCHATGARQKDAAHGSGTRQHDCAAKHSHQRPQVPAGDANQLRRRLMDRALRGPYPGHRSKQQASSDKQQARL